MPFLNEFLGFLVYIGKLFVHKQNCTFLKLAFYLYHFLFQRLRFFGEFSILHALFVCITDNLDAAFLN